jgi:hypothetical protein
MSELMRVWGFGQLTTEGIHDSAFDGSVKVTLELYMRTSYAHTHARIRMVATI